MKCRIVVPGSVDCPNDARGIVVFKDGDRVLACRDCVLRLGQLAVSMGSTVTFEPFSGERDEQRRPDPT